MRGPARRYIAVLYSLYVDAIAWLKGDEHAEALAAVEWPDITAEREAERTGRDAEAALAAYGVTVDVGRAIAARQAAMQRERQANGNNDTVTTGEADA